MLLINSALCFQHKDSSKSLLIKSYFQVAKKKNLYGMQQGKQIPYDKHKNTKMARLL